MSGIKFLLDTNIIIGLIKGNETALELLNNYGANVQISSYSFITRIELLSYPNIEDQEVTSIKAMLKTMQYLPITTGIEDMTIEIRRQYSLKIPDAIIAATAKIHNLILITLDKQLANRIADI